MGENPASIDEFLWHLGIDPSSNQTIVMHTMVIPAENPNTGYLLLYCAANAKNVQFPVKFSDPQIQHGLITISGKDMDGLLTECEEQLKMDGFEFQSQAQIDAAGKLAAKTYRFRVSTRTELSRLHYILADFEELYGNKR